MCENACNMPNEFCNDLLTHFNSIKGTHLQKLLSDEQRNKELFIEFDNIFFDFTHEKVTVETIEKFKVFVEKTRIFSRIESMFTGEKINKTENRAVLHTALRSKPNQEINVDGKNIVPDVHKVLGSVESFSQKVRNGEIRGFSNKELKNLIVIGIGGSYLGIEFVYEALKSHPTTMENCKGRKLRFLANVDPVDFLRATEDLNPEETLFLINSKTFTTAETMLNARTCRNWLFEGYRKTGKEVNTKEQEDQLVNAHVCACSTNLSETSKFGISQERVFGFWDWVGGRFSICSCIGILPLSLHFGFDSMKKFLEGAHQIDMHFRNEKNPSKNIPLMLGLLGFYHTNIQNYNSRAILPYSQALCKFAPHIQQLDMESNGKRVSIDGKSLNYQTGVINFGEPGTNSQHSFFQLLHQGRVVPCEFIGFCKTQSHIHAKEEKISNHDELMSNFFSQPDALALGKSIQQLIDEKVPENLQNHKFFPGDRPSSSFLFEELNAYTCGQLLAIYEHRTVVEGFLMDVNSFDQWGVELGKALAKNVREFFGKNANNSSEENFNSSTKKQLDVYLSKRKK